MTHSTVDAPDWSTIPMPTDDGAASHLLGMAIASVPLLSTDGDMVDLAALSGLVVVYAYPRTGRPGVANPDGWDFIPGARGCTPQTCAFRDHFAELKALGVSLFGLSTQSSSYQQEVAQRLHLPFPLLSDESLDFATAMRLPTFQVESLTLLKRHTLILYQGTIEHVFYPVFPPDRDADAVLAWLRSRNHLSSQPEATRF